MLSVILLQSQGPVPQIFNDTVTWFLLFINIFLLAGGYYYFRKLKERFEDENKKIAERLSDRSYNVMVQKWELERRNLTITHQNQEILDSLHYAKNIQSAIMPRPEAILNHFSDGFVYYLPKDIVSGDFYFIESSNDRVYVAVADCTGHGVAGAFMSMVGNSLLKQIILQSKLTDPAEILRQLNEGIVEALRQKETSSHGGMDIALCVVDKKAKTLEYAGANRPLLLVRNREMEQIKPDKLPIGGFMPDEDRRFTRHTLQLQTGDRLYMSSDGYADQFGGMEGKKMMTKKFKDLLMNIHESPMYNQQKTLSDYFQNWKGRMDQVDDVLVVGIVISD